MIIDEDKRTVFTFIIEEDVPPWEMNKMCKVLRSLYPKIETISYYKEKIPWKR
jgi:hypothetical protein